MKIKYIVFVSMLLFVAMLGITTAFLRYNDYRKLLIETNESSLVKAADTLNEMLLSSEFDIGDKPEVSKKTIREASAVNRRIADSQGLEFIWSLQKTGKTFSLTSASSVNETSVQPKHPTFLEIQENQILYEKALATGKPQFETISSDQNRRKRIAIVPYRNVNGRANIVGVIMDSSELDARLSQIASESTAIGLIILLAGLILSSIISTLLSKPLIRLMHEANEIAEGRQNIAIKEEGFHEQKELARSFNRVQSNLIENISQLSESEKTYRLLADNVSDVIWTADMNLNYTYFSPSIKKLRGFTAEEAMRISVEDTLTPESYAEAIPILMEELAKENHPDVDLDRSVTLELNQNCKDGSTIWTEVTITFLRDQLGTPEGIIGVARDISERRKALQQLQATKESFHDLFNALGSCIAVYTPIKDGEDFIFADFNQAAEEQGKISRKEIIGRRVTEVFPGVKDLGLFEIFQRVHRTGKTEHHPLKQYRDHRLISWVENTIYKLPNGQIVAVYEDTSEKRFAEEKLKSSEERFRALAENSADVIMRFDRRFRHLYVNPSIKTITGIESEKYIGKKHSELGFPEDLCRLWESSIEKVFETAQVNRIEFMLPSGIYLDLLLMPEFDSQENVKAVITSARDITEQKETQVALRHEINFVDTVLDAQFDTLFLFDPQKGKAIRWNKAFREISGYNDEEIAQLPVPSSYFSLEDLSQVEAFITEILEKGSGRIEVELVAKDGNKIPTEYQVSRVPDRDGNRHYLIAVGRDISERHKAEKIIRESEIRYRTLFESASDAIFLMQGNKFKDCNQKTLEIFGCNREDIIGKSPVDFSPSVQANGESTETLAESLISKTLSGSPQRFEWLHTKLDGTVFDAEVSLNRAQLPSGVFLQAIVRDISERKESERFRQESENRFQRLAENAPDMIYRMALPEGKYEYVSPISTEMFGYTPAEFINSPLLIKNAIHPDWKDYFAEQWEKLISGEMPPTYEYQIIHGRSGETRWIHQRNVLIRDSSGNPIAIEGIVTDLTDRKRAEDALRIERDTLQALMDGLSDTGIGVDIISSDYKILHQNRVLKDLFGEVTGKFCHQVYMGSDQPCDVCPMKHAKATSSMQRAEIVDKNGRYYEIISAPLGSRDGMSDTFVEVVIDITEHKLHEKVLLTEKQLREEYINSLPGLFYVLDEERFISWNSQLSKISGYSDEELVGMYGTDFFEGEDKTLIAEEMKKVFREGEGKVEAMFVTKDGRRIPYLLTGLRKELGGKLYLIGFGLDISDRIQAQKEKEKLESQLQLSQKLESVGRLAGGVAHDFNNLLTGITGNVQLAQMDLTPQDPLNDVLNEINRAAMRAADLTQQLLAFSRKQIIKPKVINLNELIENMQKMLVRIIGEYIEVDATNLKAQGQIKADPGQIEQIIVNLAVNSRDAMPKGGKLIIETTNESLDESYSDKHPYVIAGKYIMLAISDTGEGMDSDTRKNIFEPFFTTKPEGEGTGLGLATVYGIVKQHGGHLEVYSELDVGTTFKIYLPAVQGKAERLSKPEPLKVARQATETIFVVEDEKIVRNIAIRSLKRLGYTVISAEDGANALTMAKSQDFHVDLLLTDVVMPNMNGRELADEMQKLYPNMKILFTSGYTEDVIAQHGFLEKGLEFIGKPYSMQDLASKVRDVLDGKTDN